MGLDIDKAVGFVYQVTKDTPHTNRTLFDHLYNTYLILKEHECCIDVALAGLYHSIYGTETFQKSSGLSRELIREYIGEYSEKLVFEFSQMKDRINTLRENKNKYDIQFLVDLIQIEVANEMEMLQSKELITEETSSTLVELLKILEKYSESNSK